METLKLILQIIEAIGAIATSISLIVLLRKFRTKLNISGELPLKNIKAFLIRIYNNTAYDNEIESIVFWKGNPANLRTNASTFYVLPLNLTGYPINENTKNLSVPKDCHIDISVPCQDIVRKYDEYGEVFGKPYDTIFVVVQDRRGKKYSINTHVNIDMFRIGSR